MGLAIRGAAFTLHAYAFGNRAMGTEEAYRVAKGETVTARSTGCL